MAKIPKKVSDRFAKNVGRFQRVLADAHARDVNESDTVTVVTDVLSDVFGFDKYSDITSEQAIRGTYCDLAVKFKDKVDNGFIRKKFCIYCIIKFYSQVVTKAHFGQGNRSTAFAHGMCSQKVATCRKF